MAVAPGPIRQLCEQLTAVGLPPSRAGQPALCFWTEQKEKAILATAPAGNTMVLAQGSELLTARSEEKLQLAGGRCRGCMHGVRPAWVKR